MSDDAVNTAKTLRGVLEHTKGFLPIITEHLTQEQAIETAKALFKGGAMAIEFCLRTEGAEEAYINEDTFTKIRRACPGMLIGVGTCELTDDIDIAAKAHADFTVSATYSESVIKYAHEKGIPFVPNLGNAQMAGNVMRKELGCTMNYKDLAAEGCTGFKVAALSDAPNAASSAVNSILGIEGIRPNRIPKVDPKVDVFCTEGVKGINQFNLDSFPWSNDHFVGLGGTHPWQQIGTDGKAFSLIQSGQYDKMEALMRMTLASVRGIRGESKYNDDYTEVKAFADAQTVKDVAKGTRKYAERVGYIEPENVRNKG